MSPPIETAGLRPRLFTLQNVLCTFQRMNLPVRFEKTNPDPAIGAYPPTLPVELVLKTASIQEICESYGITEDEWNELRARPDLRADVARYKEMMKVEGMSFKLKAQLQSEELLKTSWQMIHAKDFNVPASVRADLIKATWRVAGLEPDKNAGGGNQTALQININMGD